MSGPFRTGDGNFLFQGTALSGTSATDVLDIDDEVIVNEVRLSNTTGGSINCDVELYDGTTAWKWQDTLAVGANSTSKIDTDGIPLKAAHKLRVIGDTGIHVMVTYIRAQPGYFRAS